MTGVGHITIGQFARLTGLSVKALRNYDELGLLPPAQVDPGTGYRRYLPEQAAAAATVRALRAVEMPLAAVAALLADPDPHRVRERLVAQRRRLAVRAGELQAALAALQPLIEGKEMLMGAPVPQVDPEVHRRLAADLFNRTWTLLGTEARTPEQDDEMLHCAHASRHHWAEVGTRLNLARGEWQCSRVYAVLGRGEPAVHHARRCRELLDGAFGAEDWDLPFAHEALARAHAVAGDHEQSRHHLAVATELAGAIADADDRNLVMSDLATIVPGGDAVTPPGGTP